MKFSVIVTAYNVEKYLGRCLASLKPLAQENFEIILVDDGSTDSSLKMIENFAAELPCGLCKIISKTNGGLSSARNAGLDAMTGDYVIFIDGDDYIYPEKLLELCRNIPSCCDVTICSPLVEYQTLHNLKDADANYFSIPGKGLKQISEVDLFAVPAVAWSKIYRTEIIKKIGLRFPEGLFYEDNYWYWMYMKEAKTVWFSDIVFYNYVRRPGSIMSNTFAKKKGHSIQRMLLLQKLFVDGKKLKIEEKGRLLNDFFNSAVSDCPPEEHPQLLSITQKLLSNFPNEFLTESLKKLKNNPSIATKEQNSIQISVPNRLNILLKGFRKSLKRKMFLIMKARH